MSPVGSISPLQNAGLLRLDQLAGANATGAAGLAGGASPAGAVPTDGFASLLDGLVATVSGKEATAQAVTRQVLMGNSDQLHQSVIAMQEASVAFSMMVEVRNKLVDSYQELMRMSV